MNYDFMSNLKKINMKKSIMHCLMIIGMLFVTNFVVAQEVITHTVERGETLESIAQKYHVSKSDIKKNNPYAEDVFYVGLKLYIPKTQSEKVENNNQRPNENISEPGLSHKEDIPYNKQIGDTYQNNNKNSKSISTFDPQEQDDYTEIQYHAIEDGWGIGLNGVANYFLFGLEYYFGKTNDVVTTNMGYEIYLGGNYRYHITDFLYLEGRIFAGYYHWEINIKKGYGDVDVTKTNEAFVGISPRIGLKYGKVGITAGYKWDWIKMKFKKENCLDRFTIGLSLDI